MTRILAIDPALASIGWASIHPERAPQYGTIKTSKNDSIAVRLQQIYEGIQAIAPRNAFDLVAVEMPFFNPNISNAIVVQHAVGVIRLSLHTSRYSNPIFLKANQVKKAVAGKGTADKKQIKTAVEQLYGLSFDKSVTDDAIDALAIAYAAQLGVSANIQHVKKSA